jgi:hypothetical protein
MTMAQWLRNHNAWRCISSYPSTQLEAFFEFVWSFLNMSGPRFETLGDSQLKNKRAHIKKYMWSHTHFKVQG